MEQFNIFITDNPAVVLVATLLLGAFLRDMILIPAKFLVKTIKSYLTSKSYSQAVQRIAELEADRKLTEEFIANPPRLFNKVLSDFFQAMLNLIFSFVILLVFGIFEGGRFFNAIAILPVIASAFMISATLDTLIKVYHHDEYKKRIQSAIDELKAKYNIETTLTEQE